MPKSKKEVPPLYAAPPQPYPVPQPPAFYAPPPAYVQAQPVEEKMDPWHFAAAQLLQDRNATVAKVTLVQRSTYNGPVDFEFAVTGSSKREQGDKFNARTGELLALSRAYLKLSRDLYAAGRALVEPAPEEDSPEDNFVGVGFYAAEPDEVMTITDPTDEDVEAAKEILADRAAFNAAMAEADTAAAEELVEEVDPRIVTAVEAFNGAADNLNAAVTFLRTLTD